MSDDRRPRILIVEDEAMISMLLEDMVSDLGGDIAGAAAKFEEAMTLALKADFDCAILDINVEGLAVYPIADILRYRGIPFIFVTGYDISVVPHRYQDVGILSKPFSHEAFGNALGAFLSRPATGPII